MSTMSSPPLATAACSRDRDGGNRSHQSTRADMLKFQVYILQRLAELTSACPHGWARARRQSSCSSNRGRAGSNELKEAAAS